MSAAALTVLRISPLFLLLLSNSPPLCRSPLYKVNAPYSSFSCKGVEIPAHRVGMDHRFMVTEPYTDNISSGEQSNLLFQLQCSPCIHGL